MTISLVAAMAENRVIGYQNTIPWRAPGEQKRFKELTVGKALVMGRKTYESIGRPLPDRENIIVTRNRDYEAPGCRVVHDLESALKIAADFPETCIGGGAELYKQALPLADKIFLTVVHVTVEGDTWFPEFSDTEFRLVNEERRDGPPAYTFKEFARIQK